MPVPHPYKQYQDSRILQTPPEELILMLLDRALKHIMSASKQLVLKRAKPDAPAHLRLKRLSAKCRSLDKAVEILSHLQGVLDKEAGGEIAANLERLYTYMIQELTVANYKSDLKRMKTVAKILKEIRDGWDEMLRQRRTSPEVTAPSVSAPSLQSPFQPPRPTSGGVLVKA